MDPLFKCPIESLRHGHKRSNNCEVHDGTNSGGQQCLHQDHRATSAHDLPDPLLCVPIPLGSPSATSTNRWHSHSIRRQQHSCESSTPSAKKPAPSSRKPSSARVNLSVLSYNFRGVHVLKMQSFEARFWHVSHRRVL